MQLNSVHSSTTDMQHQITNNVDLHVIFDTKVLYKLLDRIDQEPKILRRS
jgi:hypothetical protein